MIYSSLVLGALFLYMVYRPKKREPTRLKFRSSRPLPAVRRSPNTSPKSAERELTVLFQFNGHSFEAYEVLGVTPGSDQSSIEKAYQRARAQLSDTDVELLDTAYKALLAKRP